MDPGEQGNTEIIVDYSTSKLLGRGGYGRVFEGRFGATPAAIKVFNQLDNPHREDLPLKQNLRHENIVLYYGMGKNKSSIYIAMELCACNLEQLINGKYEGPSPGTMTEMMLQVTLGLQYLHDKGIIHRDLKPSNILISKPVGISPPKMKLADFGLRKELRYIERTVMLSRSAVGTLGWRAPELDAEMGSDLNYSSYSDVFSLGCIFGYSFTGGSHPFGSNEFYRSVNILEGKLDWKDEQKVADEQLRNLIKQMVSNDTKNRPPLCEILEYRIFKQILVMKKQSSSTNTANRQIAIGEDRRDIQSWYYYPVRKMSTKQDISLQDVVITVDRDKILGQGSIGTVYLGTYGENCTAIKRIVKYGSQVRLTNHLAMVYNLQHDNILRYYGHRVDENFIYIAMELCAGSVDDLIRGIYIGPSPGTIAEMMLQLTRGLQYLHSQHIIHRNLKPRKALISVSEKESKIKLNYLMHNAYLNPDVEVFAFTDFTGTMGWAPPESKIDSVGDSSIIYEYSSDIFSLGCVFGYCFSGGCHPFGDNGPFRAANIIQGKVDWKFEEKFNDDSLRFLIRRMIDIDRRKRPKIEEIIAYLTFATSSKNNSTF